MFYSNEFIETKAIFTYNGTLWHRWLSSSCILSLLLSRVTSQAIVFTQHSFQQEGADLLLYDTWAHYEMADELSTTSLESYFDARWMAVTHKYNNRCHSFYELTVSLRLYEAYISHCWLPTIDQKAYMRACKPANLFVLRWVNTAVHLLSDVHVNCWPHTSVSIRSASTVHSLSLSLGTGN